MVRRLPCLPLVELVWLLSIAMVYNAVLVECLAADEQAQHEFFEKRIRPVLVENCLSCHGATKQESGLRLDSRAALLQGGDRGPCVVVEKPAESLLLSAIRHVDDDLKMPPSKKLDERAIQDLASWIAQGVPWPESLATIGTGASEHWAFQHVRRPALPSVAHPQWVTQPIDGFVLAKLEPLGLLPSPPADRRTILRRLTFDLVGLPPTPEQVEQFVEDASPDAYERLVDRLLASPHYGERWGRYWLDIARYADTKGYVFFEDNRYPWAYTYRDYVIRSWNADLPYDQFVTQQLAADLTESPTAHSLAALGFLTVGGHFMNNTHDIIDDRMDVIMRGLQGLTLTCARCHDHKYDPIPQEDYYGLYGILRSCNEPIVPPLALPAPDTDAYRAFAAEMTTREQSLIDFVTAKHGELVSAARLRVNEYLTAAYRMREQPPADDFMLITDKGDLNPAMILRWHAYLHDTRRLHDSVWRPWRELAALPDSEFSQKAGGVLEQALRDEPPATLNPLVKAALANLPQVNEIGDIANVYHTLLRQVDDQWNAVCRAASEAGQPPPLHLDDPFEEELRSVLYGLDSPADAPMSLDWGFLSLFPDRATQDEYKKLLKQVEEWMMSADAPPRAMVLYESTKAFEPRIFQRGNPNRPGSKVARHLPTLIAPGQTAIDQGSGRRQLAKQIVDPANPLTARVLVNRIWLHHFGVGLVGTPGDFGIRGDPPTHPELLDWLASELMGDPASTCSPWSIKRLQRAIVLSATYRQTSTPRPDALNVDPENRLLWRMNPRRLDFEAMRDSTLAIADSLDNRVGGPAVEIWGDAIVPRRTVYGSLDRLNMPPLLATFDFPNPAATSPQRPETTVSPQALFLMNHPTMLETARRISELPTIRQLAEPPERIRALYIRLFGREPSPVEVHAAQDYLGESPDDESWTRYVHGLLMTNESVFVR